MKIEDFARNETIIETYNRLLGKLSILSVTTKKSALSESMAEEFKNIAEEFSLMEMRYKKTLLENKKLGNSFLLDANNILSSSTDKKSLLNSIKHSSSIKELREIAL